MASVPTLVSQTQSVSIDHDQLKQAFQGAAKDTVTKAQQEGRLTADQAKALTDRIDQWDADGRRRPPSASD